MNSRCHLLQLKLANSVEESPRKADLLIAQGRAWQFRRKGFNDHIFWTKAMHSLWSFHENLKEIWNDLLDCCYSEAIKKFVGKTSRISKQRQLQKLQLMDTFRHLFIQIIFFFYLIFVCSSNDLLSLKGRPVPRKAWMTCQNKCLFFSPLAVQKFSVFFTSINCAFEDKILDLNFGYCEKSPSFLSHILFWRQTLVRISTSTSPSNW